MDDFWDKIPIVWIIFIIIGAISSIGKSKKQQQQTQARRSTQTGQPQSPVSRPVQTASGGNRQWVNGQYVSTARPSAVQAKPAQPRPSQVVRPTESSAFVTSHSAPLETHMHTPEMGVEGEGTEGVDCCHEYMLDNEESAEPMDILSLNETDQAEKAQALLQGVIFSEILGRRRVKGYGRRSA